MGPLKKILDFLFGKDPKIFDDQGQVQHHLPQSVWDAWAAKQKNNPQNNWRHHSGTTFKKNQ